MKEIVLASRALGFPWDTVDPFLFCVHHNDAYPKGNEKLGPDVSLSGRNLGMDFEVRDGFRMYHGHVVPGFPQHPHRGFETVTIARRGLIDHSDSLGAAARFGKGDVQWLTAGKGIVHSEMFPLLRRDEGNPVELFQIWLNLPAADKMAEPHFSMLWDKDIPRRRFTDEHGKVTSVTVVAGELNGAVPPPAPPRSWASRADSDVAIWTIQMQAGARWTLPIAKNPNSVRTLYFFAGKALTVGGEKVKPNHLAVVRSDIALEVHAADSDVELLMLQGRPIGETVVQHGPFVMNSRREIEQAMMDYRRTQFGGWPWPVDDPVHGPEDKRFARHADGKVEEVDG